MICKTDKITNHKHFYFKLINQSVKVYFRHKAHMTHTNPSQKSLIVKWFEIKIKNHCMWF